MFRRRTRRVVNMPGKRGETNQSNTPWAGKQTKTKTPWAGETSGRRRNSTALFGESDGSIAVSQFEPSQSSVNKERLEKVVGPIAVSWFEPRWSHRHQRSAPSTKAH